MRNLDIQIALYRARREGQSQKRLVALLFGLLLLCIGGGAVLTIAASWGPSLMRERFAAEAAHRNFDHR